MWQTRGKLVASLWQTRGELEANKRHVKNYFVKSGKLVAWPTGGSGKQFFHNRGKLVAGQT